VRNRFLIIALSSLAPAIGVAQQPRIHDSAGVHIVENGARAKAPIAFRLADKSSFDVGGLKDNPDDELNSRSPYLRDITLANGNHLVDDQVKLRYLDASGKQLRVSGRKGAGPGEFQSIVSLCHTRGDTVVASDPANGRVTILDGAGTIVREVAVTRPNIPSDGCFDDGTWLLSQSVLGQDSVRRDKMVRYNLAGAVVGSAGEYPEPGFDLFVTRYLTFIVRGSRLYVGDPRASEVRIYDESGKLTGIVRTDDPPARTTVAEQQAMMPVGSPMTSDQSIMDRFKERLRTTPRPAQWPSFGLIRVDPDGRIWIEDYKKVRTDPDLWTAFDASGRLLGKLSMPPVTNGSDSRIISFTSGGVEVRRQDDDGAVHLTTYLLVPAKGGRP
jgi:hypothetical protein